MVRIYDAAFAAATGTQHQHLGTFWWIDDQGNQGQWTRTEAHTFVANHQRGYVYVKEGSAKVTVRAYHNSTTVWIQTEADGTTRDNLTELAERHRRGQVNN